MKLSRDQTLKLISYDPLTGEFLWLERTEETEPNKRSRDTFNKLYASKPMGTIDSISKNRVARLYGKIYYAKQIAWLIMTGEYPKGRTSHLDGDATNFRWDNIVTEKEGREARKEREQMADSSQVSEGVVYYGCNAAYKAFINLAFVVLPVGDYKSAEAAREARSARMMEMGI